MSPEPKQRKISAYIDDGTWSWTHGGPRNAIHTLFRPTWKKIIKSIFSPFSLLIYSVLAVFLLCRVLRNIENTDLIIFFQLGRNKVWIAFLGPPWVQDHVPSSIYADIFRCLGSGDIFGQTSIFSRFLQYFLSNPPDRKKYTDFVSTLRRTTARYTRTFSTIWVSIDFYFSRRKQRK